MKIYKNSLFLLLISYLFYFGILFNETYGAEVSCSKTASTSRRPGYVDCYDTMTYSCSNGITVESNALSCNQYNVYRLTTVKKDGVAINQNYFRLGGGNPPNYLGETNSPSIYFDNVTGFLRYRTSWWNGSAWTAWADMYRLTGGIQGGKVKASSTITAGGTVLGGEQNVVININLGPNNTLAKKQNIYLSENSTWGQIFGNSCRRSQYFQSCGTPTVTQDSLNYYVNYSCTFYTKRFGYSAMAGRCGGWDGEKESDRVANGSFVLPKTHYDFCDYSAEFCLQRNLDNYLFDIENKNLSNVLISNGAQIKSRFKELLNDSDYSEEKAFLNYYGINEISIDNDSTDNFYIDFNNGGDITAPSNLYYSTKNIAEKLSDVTPTNLGGNKFLLSIGNIYLGNNTIQKFKGFPIKENNGNIIGYIEYPSGDLYLIKNEKNLYKLKNSGNINTEISSLQTSGNMVSIKDFDFKGGQRAIQLGTSKNIFFGVLIDDTNYHYVSGSPWENNLELRKLNIKTGIDEHIKNIPLDFDPNIMYSYSEKLFENNLIIRTEDWMTMGGSIILIDKDTGDLSELNNNFSFSTTDGKVMLFYDYPGQKLYAYKDKVLKEIGTLNDPLNGYVSYGYTLIPGKNKVLVNKYTYNPTLGQSFIQVSILNIDTLENDVILPDEINTVNVPVTIDGNIIIQNYNTKQYKLIDTDTKEIILNKNYSQNLNFYMPNNVVLIDKYKNTYINEGSSIFSYNLVNQDVKFISDTNRFYSNFSMNNSNENYFGIDSYKTLNGYERLFICNMKNSNTVQCGFINFKGDKTFYGTEFSGNYTDLQNILFLKNPLGTLGFFKFKDKFFKIDLSKSTINEVLTEITLQEFKSGINKTNIYSILNGTEQNIPSFRINPFPFIGITNINSSIMKKFNFLLNHNTKNNGFKEINNKFISCEKKICKIIINDNKFGHKSLTGNYFYPTTVPVDDGSGNEKMYIFDIEDSNL